MTWPLLKNVLTCAALAGALALSSCSAPAPRKHKARAHEPAEVKIILTGDIMLSRYVAAQIQKSKNPLLPFEKLTDFLQSSDFNFANLEAPISGSDKFTPTGSMVFNVPRANIEGLERYNFKILSLANNHALDQGPAGAAYTRQYLTAHGILCVGTGSDIEQAWQPAIVEAKGRKIGFLAASYSSYNDGGKQTNRYVARIEDLKRLRERVAELKTKAGLIIVSMHAGNEYATRLTDGQAIFAHAAIDAGADIVTGAHPHCVQAVEQYKSGLIFYSLGNFIFDQHSPEAKQGLAVKLTLSGARRVTAELYPLEIERYCCPRMASEAAAKEVLARAHVTSRVIRLERGQRVSPPAPASSRRHQEPRPPNRP
jgi:poly-gamma-glutamate synthesis protein (capsule biosynthesis protein)